MSLMFARLETCLCFQSRPGSGDRRQLPVSIVHSFRIVNLSNSIYLVSLADPNEVDIIDETLDLFRANSFFRNFEIKGPADRLLIILILFVSDCLAKVGATRTPPTQIEAAKTLNTLAVDTFPLPGDVLFPLNSHYSAAPTRQDSGKLLC